MTLLKNPAHPGEVLSELHPAPAGMSATTPRKTPGSAQNSG